MVKYDFTVDISQDNNSHTKIIKMSDKGKDVLEIGPSTGYMTKILKEQFSHRVSCIEINEEAAEKAKPYCEKMVISNIETLHLGDHFAPATFDVIILADVLEHLKDPWAVLVKLKPYLRDDGCILASIPNVGYIGLVLELMEGRFRYRELGLLDSTHLRFFTRESIWEMFEAGGYRITDWDCTVVPPQNSEFGIRMEKYPAEVVAFIQRNPDAYVYQFIVKAHKE
ncbi:MAG: class I SAM-dependent methyltransferase [Bacillota bacterium]